MPQKSGLTGPNPTSSPYQEGVRGEDPWSPLSRSMLELVELVGNIFWLAGVPPGSVLVVYEAAPKQFTQILGANGRASFSDLISSVLLLLLIHGSLFVLFLSFNPSFLPLFPCSLLPVFLQRACSARRFCQWHFSRGVFKPVFV